MQTIYLLIDKVKAGGNYFLNRPLPIILFFLVAIEFSYWWFSYLDTAQINIYFVRDLDRAKALSEGIWTLRGSDTTGGGYTPGPLFYWLILPPVLLGGGYELVFFWLVLLRSVSHSLAAFAIFPDRKKDALLLWFFWAASPAIFDSMVWPNNSTLNDALACWILVFSRYCFIQRQKGGRSRFPLFLLGLLIGFSMHVHYSLFLMIIPTAALFTDRGSKDFIKCLVLMVFGLLLPLTSALADPELYLPGVVSIWRHLQIQAPVIINSFFGNWEFLEEYWVGPQNVSALAILLFMILVGKRKGTPKSDPWLAKMETVFPALSIAMLPWAIQPGCIRYFMVILVTSIPHLVYQMRHCFTFRRSVFVSLLILGFPLNFNYLRGTRDTMVVSELKAFADVFNSRCITFEQMERSTYEILGHIEEGGFMVSRPYFHCSSPPKRLTSRFLVVSRKRWNDSPSAIANLKLPSEIKKSLLAGWSRRIEHPMPYRLRLFEWPDDIIDPDERKTNLVYTYQYDPAIQLQPPGEVWRICSVPYFCDVRVAYKIKDDKLLVRLGGRPLASRWFLPPVTARLLNLRVMYRCGNKSFSEPLTESIGIDWRDPLSQDSTYLADFIGKLPLACSNFSELSITTEKILTNVDLGNPDSDSIIVPSKELKFLIPPHAKFD